MNTLWPINKALFSKNRPYNKIAAFTVAVAQPGFKWLNNSICTANGYSAIFF